MNFFSPSFIVMVVIRVIVSSARWRAVRLKNRHRLCSSEREGPAASCFCSSSRELDLCAIGRTPWFAELHHAGTATLAITDKRSVVGTHCHHQKLAAMRSHYTGRSWAL